MAVTLRFQSTGAIPGSGEPVTMNGPSLTIGRGDENDMVLPDPDRMISKRHCVVEDHNGNVVVVDISTNGTFLNYGKVPLGNVPTPLNDGDILSLGPYELLVDIASDRAADPMANIADPLADGPVSHGQAGAAPSISDLLDSPGDKGDFLDDLLGGREPPQGPRGVQRETLGDDGLLPPLGDDEADILGPAPDPGPTQGASDAMHNPAGQDHFHVAGSSSSVIPDDWDDDLLGTGGPAGDDPFAAPPETPAPAAAPSAGSPAFIPEDEFLGDVAPPGQAAPVPDDAPQTAPQAPPQSAPADPATPAAAAAASVQHSSGANDEASRAFLRAAGAGDLTINDADLTPTMSRLGHVLRIMIHGMREILMTRTSIKSEFRIEQTMISAGGNNPLKFSISPEQAVEAMVKPSSKGYLDATDAAEQALKDIKAHEIAMVTGMEAALKGVLKRLDPAALEEKIETGGGLGNILKGKKARYWEVYEKMYAEISDQAENDFQELFSREFARAYKEQLERLK